MPFSTGRITMTQLAVVGDAPTHVDDAFLSILAEHRFIETEIGAPDAVEAGFVTGQHLYDTQFSFEKNAFGTIHGTALFAVRIDTHTVPPAVKQAYRRMNEQAAASASPTGFASKAEKKDADDQAARQLHDELAAGKFRRSKLIELMWDFAGGRLYVATASLTAIEQIARLMREAFAVDVEYLSAGVLAGRHFRRHGKQRDYEDLKPAKFTPPPPLARQRADDADQDHAPDLATPIVPWVAKGVDLKDFLGNELLLWLWAVVAKEDGVVDDDVFIAIDRVLDLDCAWEVGGKDTFRGDGPHRLKEAVQAIKTGKWPRKMGLIVSDGEHQWQLTLQGDQWIVSAMALPEIEDVQSPRELIDARLVLIRDAAQVLERLLIRYLDVRREQHTSELASWIRCL